MYNMNIHEDKQAKEEDVVKMLLFQVESEGRRVQEQQVRSETCSLYQGLCETASVNRSKCIQALNRNYITYSTSSPFQPFTFHVEKTFPGHGYFLIQVKIAHFTLNVSAIRHPFPIKVDSKTSDIKSTFAKIHFVDYGDQKLCFKSFLFRNQEEFQVIFAEALKEWTLLKICSVLECGPFIGNEMGFDIVIYDDCIQYQTQKGKQFKEVNRSTISELKQQLKIMHSFKIIHQDIKPQNIVMSKHFKKPIFIDFGFSDIIKEDVGFKTLTVFRGTPDFCTSEMLATMMKREGYVDLYYNDAYGLDLVFKKLVEEQQATFQQEQGDNEVASFQKPAEPLDHQWEIEAFFAFQYHYINSNIFRTKELMACFVVKDPQNIKKVLKFIKSISNHLFLSEVFECLREYSHMLQYKEIQQKIRVEKAMLFQREREDEDNSVAEPVICEPISNYNKHIHDGLKYQVYMRIIANFREDEVDQIDSLIYILFDSIRFDIKNLTLEEKTEIAIKINPIFISFCKKSRAEFEMKEAMPQSNQKNAMQQVQLLMILILQYCLQQRSNKWIKDNIFQVCQQLLLMDVDFTQHITRLNQYVSIQFRSLTDLVLAHFQYSRLRQTSIMIQTRHSKQQNQLLSIINDKVLELSQKAMAYQETADNAEYSLLKKMVKTTTQGQCIANEEQEQVNRNIKSAKLRKFILIYSIQRKIEDLPTSMSQELLEFIQYIKKSNQLKNLGLVCYMRLIVKALSNLNNFQGIQSYCNYISSIINCPFISNLFIIDPSPLLICDPHSVTSKIAKYARLYSLLPRHRQEIDKSFSVIFRFVNRRKIATEQPLLGQINKFCQIYRRDFQLFDDAWHANASALNGIYYKINLDFEMSSISPQTLDFFFGNYLLCKSNWQKRLKQNEGQQLDASALTLKFMLLYYEYHMCKLYNEGDSSLPIIQQLKSISKFFNNHFLVLELLKLEAETIVCSQIGNDLLNACALQIYSFCKSIGNISFYLVEGNLIEAFFIFKTLESTNQDLFLALIYQIIDFLHRYQFEPYFHNFVKLVDYFLQLNPGRGVTLHFSKFQTKMGSSPKNNPYLLIFYAYSLRFEQYHSQLRLFKAIAANCDNLNGLPKKKIMQKYFTVMLDSFDSRMRRKKICVFRLGKQYLSGAGIRKHGKQWSQVRKTHFIGEQIFYKIAYEKMQLSKFYLSA